MHSRLGLTRQQIPAFRRRVGGLDERLPAGSESLQRAAWAGLQRASRGAVEAGAMPLPGLDRPIEVVRNT